MTMFKLGVQGEGFAFFLPDTYSKDTKIIGTQLRRTISGKANRDVTATKRTFSIGFNFLDEDEVEAIYIQFLKHIEQGKELTFGDDVGEYKVIWATENFGISERQPNADVYWSGNITLEEV